MFSFINFIENWEESKRVKELETSVINTTQTWETTITSYHLMEPPLHGKAQKYSFNNIPKAHPSKASTFYSTLAL